MTSRRARIGGRVAAAAWLSLLLVWATLFLRPGEPPKQQVVARRAAAALAPAPATTVPNATAPAAAAAAAHATAVAAANATADRKSVV